MPESEQPIRARKSVWRSVSHCSCTRCRQLPSPVHALTPSSSISSVSGRTGGQTTTQRPSNEKTAPPHLPTTACMTKTSKQKKTNEEKQAKKKELDRAALRGGALEARWSAAVTEGEGPGSCTRSNFQALHSPLSTLFSVLPTAALRWVLLYYLILRPFLEAAV